MSDGALCAACGIGMRIATEEIATRLEGDLVGEVTADILRLLRWEPRASTSWRKPAWATYLDDAVRRGFTWPTGS
jgi:hypothetical protein